MKQKTIFRRHTGSAASQRHHSSRSNQTHRNVLTNKHGAYSTMPSKHMAESRRYAQSKTLRSKKKANFTRAFRVPALNLRSPSERQRKH